MMKKNALGLRTLAAEKTRQSEVHHLHAEPTHLICTRWSSCTKCLQEHDFPFWAATKMRGNNLAAIYVCGADWSCRKMRAKFPLKTDYMGWDIWEMEPCREDADGVFQMSGTDDQQL